MARVSIPARGQTLKKISKLQEAPTPAGRKYPSASLINAELIIVRFLHNSLVA